MTTGIQGTTQTWLAQAQTPPPQSQSPADQAVARIRELMQDGGILEDDLTNGELKEIVQIFDGLDATQARDALSQLSNDEINKIVGEMQGGGIGNFAGLSQGERGDFVADLAGKLDAAQFQRVATSFGEPQEIANILATHGTTESRVGFVQAHAGSVSNAAQPGAWYENLGGATIRYGNEEARAVGTVLASLAGDQAGLSRAIGGLSPAQLDAVVGASMGMTSRSAAGPGGLGSLPAYSFDDTRINAILDAAATSNDPALKAEVFSSASRALGQVQGVGGILTPSVDAGSTATSIANHMSDLLRSDTRGIVAQLEANDPTGAAITPWTRQMLASDNTDALNAVLGDLRNGPNNDAVAYLSDPEVAEDLGYMIGGIASGLNSLQASAKDEAALVNKLLGFGIGRIPQVSSVVSFASEQVVNRTIGQVESGTKQAPVAFYELMVNGLPATTQGTIDSAMSRVINLQNLGR